MVMGELWAKNERKKIKFGQYLVIFEILAKYGHFEVHMTKSAGYQPNMPYIGYMCHILIRHPGPVILVGVAP